MIFDFNTKAKDVFFNNSNNDLSSTNVQDAINETYDTTKIIGTATGEHITITNSTEASVREFKVDGKTEQVTTSGKNVFDISKALVGGFDSNGDFSLHNGTQDFYKYNFKENTQYTFSGYAKNSVATSHVRLKVFYTDGTEDATCMFNGTTEYMYVTYTSALNKTISKISVYYSNPGMLYIKDGKLQIEEGAVATEYEPYTGGVASPNPDYPQDIKGVGDNGEVEVTVTGKNMFDNDKYTNYANYRSLNNYWNYMEAPELLGKIVTVSAQSTFQSNSYHLGLNNSITEEPTSDNRVLVDGTKKTITIDFTNSDKAVLWIANANGSISTTISTICEELKNCSVQIEEGTVATEYEPYKSQTVKIPVEHLIDPSPLYKGDYARLKDKNVEIVKNNKMVVFDGSDDEQWEYFYFTGINQFFLPCNEAKFVSDTNEIHVYSEQFRGIAENDRVDNYETIYTMTNGGNNRICINTKRAYAVEEWKTWLSQNPITVVYELAEPITETMATEIDLSTYNHVTNITNSDNANMEVEYFVNSANGNVVLEMQKELQKEIAELDNKKADKKDISRLDREKANISLLKDYVVSECIVENDAILNGNDTNSFTIDIYRKSGYNPLFWKCETNNLNVFCTKTELGDNDLTCYLKNLSSEKADFGIFVTVIYVKII